MEYGINHGERGRTCPGIFELTKRKDVFVPKKLSDA
jgi:hypothetical protein